MADENTRKWKVEPLDLLHSLEQPKARASKHAIYKLWQIPDKAATTPVTIFIAIKVFDLNPLG